MCVWGVYLVGGKETGLVKSYKQREGRAQLHTTNTATTTVVIFTVAIAAAIAVAVAAAAAVAVDEGCEMGYVHQLRGLL